MGPSPAAACRRRRSGTRTGAGRGPGGPANGGSRSRMCRTSYPMQFDELLVEPVHVRAESPRSGPARRSRRTSVEDGVVAVEQLALWFRERLGHPDVVDRVVLDGNPDESVGRRWSRRVVVVEHVDVVGGEEARVVAEPDRKEDGLVVDDRLHGFPLPPAPPRPPRPPPAARWTRSEAPAPPAMVRRTRRAGAPGRRGSAAARPPGSDRLRGRTGDDRARLDVVDDNRVGSDTGGPRPTVHRTDHLGTGADVDLPMNCRATHVTRPAGRSSPTGR